MSVGGESKICEPAEEIRRKHDRIVEEAVEKAACRMDADEHEREVLETVAKRLSERITRPVIESAGADDAEVVKLLFFDSE